VIGILILATLIDIRITSANQVQPEQRVTNNSTASAKGTGQTHKKQTPSAETASEPTLTPQPSSQNAGSKQEKETDTKNAARDQKQQDIDIQRKLTAYTKWLVIVGIIQFVALIAQGLVFLFTLLEAKDTSKRELRAYIGIPECALKLEPADVPEGQVHVKNFGQTPAYNVRQWTGIAIFPHPLTYDLPAPPENLRQSNSSIYPGAHHINVAPVKQPLSPQICSILGKPECTVYVWGRVIYEDVFGREWSTHYRFFWGGRDGGRTKKDSRGVLLGLMQVDSEGNYGD
jgi:hypothetical protein